MGDVGIGSRTSGIKAEILLLCLNFSNFFAFFKEFG